MYVRVNGIKLFFDVDGESLTPDGKTMRQKPTVIMVHGGPGGDHSVSKPYFSQLTDIAQVIYYDHRGNGRSDFCDGTSWNLAQWGDDLKGLCDALGIVSPIVIGTSFGGFVTLSYAARHPGHAAGLALISTAAKVNFQSIYSSFERLGGPAIRNIAQAYWENPTAEGRALYRDRCVPFTTITGPPLQIGYRASCGRMKRLSGSTGRATNMGEWIFGRILGRSNVRRWYLLERTIPSPRLNSATKLQPACAPICGPI